MRFNIGRVLAVAMAVAALTGTAQAQGKGHGNGHGNGHGKGHGGDDRNGSWRATGGDDRDDGRYDGRYDDRYDGRYDDRRYGADYGRKVPPGLAKKPGQMPPGQYKKRYGTSDGAWVLSDVLRRRGYAVTRLATVGDSRDVYYRSSDGALRRAIVRPGSDRLAFSNVPATVLREVLARLY